MAGRSTVLALCVPLALLLSALPLRAEPLGATLEARIPPLMEHHWGFTMSKAVTRLATERRE